MTTATEHKLQGTDEVGVLLNSRRKAILVNTYEEERFQEELKSLIESKSYQGLTWTVTSGLYDVITGEQVQKIYDPLKLMDFIQKYDKQAIFILKDFHDIWANYQAKRALRDVLEGNDPIYKPIVLISPQTGIPQELEKLITVVKYELPTREQVIEQVEGMESYLKSKDLERPEGREREAIINALVGMTKLEMINVLKKSVAKNRKIILDEIVAEKEQVIRKTGLLEYITKLGDMDQVGGMDVMKSWFDDAFYAFDPEAREYNVDPVRGCIAAGFPGVGKSLTAKSVAHQWNLPLLKMNMSDIMDSRVGQSEKNIDRALKLAEAVSPCVLWIDELEKGLAGIASSDKSDSGTLSRVVQSILTWLSDKTAPVFVIATANDITKLPPELTRAGRFDEIFFVSVPSASERVDILEIHLKKRGYYISKEDNTEMTHNDLYRADIEALAEEMVEFTGAEIEQVVAESGRRAYAAWRKNEREQHQITINDLREQISQVIPMAKRNPQLLVNLRDWAKHSAKCASSEEHKLLHDGAKGKSKLMSLSSFDVNMG
jgi:ATP-dependent 26S proteasome regulatory subunit